MKNCQIKYIDNEVDQRLKDCRMRYMDNCVNIKVGIYTAISPPYQNHLCPRISDLLTDHMTLLLYLVDIELLVLFCFKYYLWKLKNL